MEDLEQQWEDLGRPQADRGIIDQAFRRFARSSLGLPTLLYQIGGRRWLEDFDMRWEDLGRPLADLRKTAEEKPGKTRNQGGQRKTRKGEDHGKT